MVRTLVPVTIVGICQNEEIPSKRSGNTAPDSNISLTLLRWCKFVPKETEQETDVCIKSKAQILRIMPSHSK